MEGAGCEGEPAAAALCTHKHITPMSPLVTSSRGQSQMSRKTPVVVCQLSRCAVPMYVCTYVRKSVHTYVMS